MRVVILVAFAATFLASCDDCESDGLLQCLREQDRNRIEKLGGIWRGTLTHTEITGSQSVVAIVSESGDFRLISTSGIQASGRVEGGRRSASGSLRFFPAEGATFSEDRKSINGNFEGSAEEATTLNGDWEASADNDVKGEFRLTYDEIYAEDSSLARLAGNYSAQDGTGFSRSIVAQDNGDIEGSDSDGCNYAGSAEIIDTEWNAYRLTIAVSDCDERAGDYAGLGFLAGNGTELTAQVTGGNAVVSFVVAK